MEFRTGESELGDIVGSIHGGNVIINCKGDLIFVSSAINPLTARDLRDIALEMEDYECYTGRGVRLSRQVEELTKAQLRYSLRNWTRTGWTNTL